MGRWVILLPMLGCGDGGPHYVPPPCEDMGTRVVIGRAAAYGTTTVDVSTDLGDDHYTFIQMCWNAGGDVTGLAIRLEPEATDAFAATGDVSVTSMISRTTVAGTFATGEATGQLHFAAGTISGAIHSTKLSIDADISGLFDMKCTAVGKADPYFETSFCKMFDGLRP